MFGTDELMESEYRRGFWDGVLWPWTLVKTGSATVYWEMSCWWRRRTEPRYQPEVIAPEHLPRYKSFDAMAKEEGRDLRDERYRRAMAEDTGLEPDPR